MTTDPCAPGGRWPDCDLLGSAQTGLVGPFAGNGTLRIRPRWNRFAPDWSRKIPGDPDTIDGPQRIHAGAVPVKRLRGLMQAIAQQRHAHALFGTPFPDDVDLAVPLTGTAVPCDGTWQLLRQWQRWFAQHYARLQQAAVANGRWFPPPTSLQLTRQPDGTVTVSAKFAPGYVAANSLLTACHPPMPRVQLKKPNRPPLRELAAQVSAADAALQAAQAQPAPVSQSSSSVKPPWGQPVWPSVQGGPYVDPGDLPGHAQPWAPHGAQLLLADYVAGFQHHQGAVVIEWVRPGDTLRLQPEPQNPHDALAVALYWHHFKLGYVPRNLNQPVAHLLAMGMPLLARVVAIPHSQVPWQRVAFAVFMTPPAVQPPR